ncbi:hypothetical protein GDO78_015161 [Eleutherodactylus coqui]|uniref:Uncharacterized protein n=1 Tax=Eleutherodactylus coqui TaxID=57060 RepID=A0A8J6ELY4_ELECQ|nr:hypothetical protein GDO78_015161 [Eleutherodactylus coqui]
MVPITVTSAFSVLIPAITIPTPWPGSRTLYSVLAFQFTSASSLLLLLLLPSPHPICPSLQSKHFFCLFLIFEKTFSKVGSIQRSCDGTVLYQSYTMRCRLTLRIRFS